ncbi:MAG: lipid-A-disaccharide synthase N-terminal domain-containing protein [Bacteroidales bacterium]|nr:lipid-A-disaccharide synthase N-terminal domain-containing protein [Bacteroidales bacterium]
MIYVIGLLAQLFFGARTVLQWILSERAKKVLSPSIYWILSILGAYLFFIYGWLREDFAIIFGQIISYYIYIWNLKIKGVWQKVFAPVRILLIVTPVVAIILAAENAQQFIATFLRNDNIPLWLVIFGSIGQVLFTFRFIYQIIYSARRKESILPLGFWVISLTGSSLIISYAIMRMDPVLILGQSAGFIAYIRNIAIYHKHRRSS